MTYNQAFPKLYRKLKQHNITYNSLTLIDKLKKVEEKYGEIKDSYLDTIVNQILASKNKSQNSNQSCGFLVIYNY